MKIAFFFIVLGSLAFSFSSLIQEQCPMIVEILKKTFKDDFFEQYKCPDTNKLVIITKNEDVYNELMQCRFDDPIFLVDSTYTNQTKYLSIDDYRHGDKIFRLQIMCYNTENELYSILYSISFILKDYGNNRLMEELNTYVDTVQFRVF